MKRAFTLVAGAVAVGLAASAPAREPAAVQSSHFNIRNLRVHGLVQTQFGAVRASTDTLEENWHTFEVRRVRLGLGGTVLPDVHARVEADLVPGSDLTMRSAFLEWRAHARVHAKAGYDKPRFGFEENTSAAALLTVERSLIGASLAPGAMAGLSVSGTYNLFSYGAGVYSDQAKRNPDYRSPRYLSNVSAEAALDPWVGQTLRLRADYLDSGDDAGQFGARYTGAISASLHFATARFDLRAEFLSADHRNSNGTTRGVTVMPSWRFTEKWQGTIRIENASSDDETGLNAADRYVRRVPGLAPSEDVAPARGDGYRALYAGVTYYLAGHHHKLMFGIERSELDTVSSETLKASTIYGAWRMRF